MLKDLVEYIEEKVSEYDKFVTEVDCGDDLFIIYGTQLTAMTKILDYAKEQKKIYDDQTKEFMSRDDFLTR